MDQLHIWNVTIDGTSKTFPTLEVAVTYLKKTYTPAAQTVVLESQVLVPEEFRTLRREDVE